MERYTHIEDGHIGGDHGKTTLGERMKYTAILAGTIFSAGYVGALVVREKVAEVRIDSIRNDLKKVTHEGEKAKIMGEINKCETKFDECDGAVSGGEEEENMDDVDVTDEKKPRDMDALTNFPAHTRCTATRLACFEAIKTK